MPNETLTCDVAVVGAGLAGLAVAGKLVERGLEPLVLEARSRVGGRLVNESLSDGVVTEMGGQWMNPLQKRVAALADELELETFVTHSTGDSLMETEDSLVRHATFDPAPDESAERDYEKLVRYVREIVEGMPPEARESPWRYADAERLDGLSLDRWMVENQVSEHGRELIRLTANAYWAAEPGELTLLHLAFCVATSGTSNLRDYASSELESRRFVGGSARLPQLLAERLAERIVADAPVTGIEQTNGGVGLAAGDRRVEARRCVVTVPPPLIAQISFDPQLPATKAQLIQRSPMGNGARITAGYAEPFWRGDGLSGRVVSLRGPLGHIYDNSPPEAGVGALTGFIGGRSAWDLARQSPEERRAAVVGQLGRCFGDRAGVPERYLEKLWVEERWTRGGWSGVPAPGAWVQLGHSLREPFGRVHWAGSETAGFWYGHMEGALESAERVTAEILDAD